MFVLGSQTNRVTVSCRATEPHAERCQRSGVGDLTMIGASHKLAFLVEARKISFRGWLKVPLLDTSQSKNKLSLTSFNGIFTWVLNINFPPVFGLAVKRSFPFTLYKSQGSNTQNANPNLQISNRGKLRVF